MIEIIYKLIICHLIGDYVLQSDFIAKTKGENWYHLLIHCFLYSLPFYFVFGYSWKLIFVIIMHILIDPLKARYNKISYAMDQIVHYVTLLVYLF